jgi:hypothetical protein
MPAPLSRRDLRVATRFRNERDSIGPLPVVDRPKGHVIIAATESDAIRARGKVEPALFFPGYATRLAELGCQLHFAGSLAEIAAVPDHENACLIELYNEERTVPAADRHAGGSGPGGLIFNHPDAGRQMGDKRRTNAALTAAGVAMPPLADGTTGPVFTNEAAGTSRHAWVVEDRSALDPERYNTAFIDTTFRFEGRAYFSTVRLLCVGPRIVHSFVGLRVADRARPSVHGVSTPLNAALYNAAYAHLFEARRDEHEAIAQGIDRALGPGFYHHDLLVPSDGGPVLVAEVGYKFDAYAFATRMAPVRDAIPSLQPFVDGSFARWSADATIATWQARRQGATVPGSDQQSGKMVEPRGVEPLTS